MTIAAMIALALFQADPRLLSAQLSQMLGVEIPISVKESIPWHGPSCSNDSYRGDECSRCDEVIGAVQMNSSDYDDFARRFGPFDNWRRPGGHAAINGYPEPPRTHYYLYRHPDMALVLAQEIAGQSQAGDGLSGQDYCANREWLHIRRLESENEIHITFRALTIESVQ